MKNIFNSFFLLIVAVLFVSCSEDESVTPQSEDFFNLNVGSQWVYKKYDNNLNNPEVFVFQGVVDTVKIVDHITIGGLEYAIKTTKRVNINSNQIISEQSQYVRVNSLGHLVAIVNSNNEEQVIHAGNDYDFVEVREQGIFGTTEYKLYEQMLMNVEGNTYTVVPFNGVFTPNEAFSNFDSKTIEYNFQKGVGLVKFVCHSISGTYTWEERLVDYELVE
jgi:hypothetical protein